LCCPSLHTEDSTLQRDPGNSGERRGKGKTARNTLRDGSHVKSRKAGTNSVLQPNPEESSEGEEITIGGCGPVIIL